MFDRKYVAPVAEDIGHGPIVGIPWRRLLPSRLHPCLLMRISLSVKNAIQLVSEMPLRTPTLPKG